MAEQRTLAFRVDEELRQAFIDRSEANFHKQVQVLRALIQGYADGKIDITKL